MATRTQRRAEQRRVAKLARKAATAATSTPLNSQFEPTPAPEKPQASEAQIAANRENATHSTGPRSEIGKATVSQNRRTHGLLSSVFTVLACENQAEYDLLLKTLLAEHLPANTTECLLVTSMAQHRWLLDRATRLQETTLDPQTAQIIDQKLFSLYLRYATTHERAFHKCLNDLLKVRKQAQRVRSCRETVSETSAAATDPSCAHSSEEQTRQIGFESQKRQAERHESRQRLDEIKLSTRQLKLRPEETTAGMENSKENQPPEVATAA